MTTYSDPMLISCPHCSALSELGRQLASMSVFFSFVWTDGAASPNGDLQAYALSDVIRRCWRCSHYFWIREAKRECAARTFSPPSSNFQEQIRARERQFEELRKVYGDRLPAAHNGDRHDGSSPPPATAKTELAMAIEDGIARNKSAALALHRLCLFSSNNVFRSVFCDGMRDFFPSGRYRWPGQEPEENEDAFLQWDEERYFQMLRLLQRIAPAWMPEPALSPPADARESAPMNFPETERSETYDRQRSLLSVFRERFLEFRARLSPQYEDLRNILLRSKGRPERNLDLEFEQELSQMLSHWSRKIIRLPSFHALTATLLELLEGEDPKTILLRAELHRERGECDAGERELARLDGVTEATQLVRFHRRLLKEDLVIPVVIPDFAGGAHSAPTINIRL